MKQIFSLKASFLFLLLSAVCLLHAQTTTFYWNFGTVNALTPQPDPTNSDPTVATITENVTQGRNYGTTVLISTTSVSSGYIGASGGANAAMAVPTITSFDPNTAAYFEITITPTDPNAVLTINSISFGSRVTSTGPTNYAVLTSIDGFTNSIISGDLGNTGVTTTEKWNLMRPIFPIISYTVAGGSITIRIYAFGQYPGTSTASNNTANWRIDDLSISATAAPIALPIKFISFTVEKKNKINELNWQTASEFNVKNFNIESSGDGMNFQTIGQVAAKNISSGANYTYADKEIIGKEFYRIASIDFDGAINYTPIVFAQNDNAPHLQFKNTIAVNDLQFVSDEQGTLKFIIATAAGNVMANTAMAVSNGTNKIDVSYLPKGLYFFKATFNGVTNEFKFLKN